MKFFLLLIASGLSAQTLPFPGPGLFHVSGGGGTTCTPATGYAHCRSLTMNHLQIGGTTLTNYPVLLNLTGANALGAGKILNSSCFDVRITVDAPGATVTAAEPMSALCDSSTGSFNAWFMVSSLSATVDTVYFVHYGNASQTTTLYTGPTAPSVMWSSNFTGPIYHFDGSLNLSDSSGSGFTASNTGSHAVSAAGVIGNGASFNGTNAEITGHQWGPYTSFTVSEWFTPANNTTIYQYFFSGSGSLSTLFVFNYGTNNKLSGYINTAGGADNNLAAGGSIMNVGTPYLITAIYNGSGNTYKLFMNGNNIPDFQNSSAVSGAVVNFSSDPERIGGNSIQGQYAAGVVDEFRFNSAPLPDSWHIADYNSQRPGSTFLTIGPEI